MKNNYHSLLNIRNSKLQNLTNRFINIFFYILFQNIDGNKLLELTQNDVMALTGMKVGPSLKIQNLVQQLLAIVNPAKARYQATLMKRGLSFGKS